MNKLKKIRFKTGVLFLCLGILGVSAQEKTKTYTENFMVNEETVLELDTSHSDIEFETWDKDQVSIEAVVVLEGATSEEAEAYFQNPPVKIMGNSQKIEIKTASGHSMPFVQSFGNFNDIDFEVDIPDIEPIVVEIPDVEPFVMEIPEIMEMPPMPPVTLHKFDYQAYKRDGAKYLKKWQKEFEKGYDEEYKEKMEEWAKRMESRRSEWEKRKKRLKEREEAREKQREAMVNAREARREQIQEVRKKMLKVRERQLEAVRDRAFSHRMDSTSNIFIYGDGPNEAPNIFYFNSNGENKNYKVKKTIKIKMPRNTKIKMNVRHGEVKLAENTKNIDATLSHASLWASTIDGEKTDIRAKYSPVSVKRWNYGQLQADYSENVSLEEVLNLRLSATSSEVSIEHILKSAFIKNDFGPLFINMISENFMELDVSLENAELICNLPQTAYTLYVNGTNSNIKAPDHLTLQRTKNLNTDILKGYHLKANNSKSIAIHSKFSEVILE